MPTPVRAHPAAPRPPLPQSKPAPAAAPKPEGKRSVLPMILGVLALIVVGVGAFVALKRPAAHRDRAAREGRSGARAAIGPATLVELAALPDATEAQLARAGALLVEAKEWDARALARRPLAAEEPEEPRRPPARGEGRRADAQGQARRDRGARSGERWLRTMPVPTR